MENPESFADLVAIMDRLRGPEGCPWDREQTFESLRRFLLEECHEVVDALDHGDRDALREELGDLLFQIVFLSRLAKEEGRFTVDDVIRGIAGKMVRRHPHVFGDATAETPDEVLRHWEEIKRQERKQAASSPEAEGSLLDGIPRTLSALLRAEQLGSRAARVGFDWEREGDVLAKVAEELEEVRRAVKAGERRSARDEIGDLLFATAMLARHLEVDPESALDRANRKFARRFRRIEREVRRRGLTLREAGAELMERIWNEAKDSETDG